MTEEKKKEIRNMLVVQWVGGVGVSKWEGCAKHHATSFDQGFGSAQQFKMWKELHRSNVQKTHFLQ